MSEPYARPGERVDDLALRGLRLIQKTDGQRFTMDAVLLSDFAAPRPRERAADLGTGTGVIPFLLWGRAPDIHVTGVEIDPDMADMADRSVQMNGAQAHIEIRQADVRDLPLENGAYTLVTCNPPYYDASGDCASPAPERARARSGQHAALIDFMRAAARGLQNGGRFCAVYPASRMLRLMDDMRRCALEPKRMRLVYATRDSAPKLILVQAMLRARPGLAHMPPLILADETGAYTNEYRRIYHMQSSAAPTERA